MARRRSRRSHRSHLLSYENPRSSRRSRRSSRRSHRGGGGFRMFRLNPTGTSGADMAQRGIMASLVVGSIGAASLVLISSTVQYFGAANASSVGWTPTIKSLAKIGIGLGAGWGAAQFIKNPAVPMGIALGGVISGLRDLYVIYVSPSMPSFLQLPGTIVTVPAPVTTPVTTPAAQAFLPSGGYPAGIPQSYQPQTAQSFAVPRMYGR